MRSRWERSSRKVVLVCIIAQCLTACGGGGGGDSGGSGGGGGGSGNSLRFTLDKSSISFDYVDTQWTAPVSVTATASGNLPDALYIGAQDLNGFIEPKINTYINGVTGRFDIQPRTTLVPGTYNGTLNLLACADANCTRQLGNSPLPVSYSIRVRPGLKVTATNLTTPVTFTSGEQGSVNYAVQLPENATSFAVQTINGGSICHLENITATGFTLVGSLAPSGDYICQFQVDAGGRFTANTVNFKVLTPVSGDRPMSVREQTGLTFTGVEGAQTAPQRLHVTPPSWDSRYDVVVDRYGGTASGWLQLTRTSDGFDVVADAAHLAQGTYSAMLNVSSPSKFANTSIGVGVSITVGAGLVRPPDVVRTVDSESVAADLSATVPIALIAGPQQQWTAASNAAWLTLPSTTGQTGGTLAFDYNNAAFRALKNGREHVASITVTAANSSISPVTFDVHVTKRLAQVTGLGPYLHLSGKPLHAYVRGIGFSAASNLSRMRVAGLPNAAFTYVNDTTLTVDVPTNVAAGAYTVSTSNSLGVTMASRTLKVIDPVSYTYATVPVGKSVGNVMYDAERRRVYVTRNPNGDGGGQPNLFLTYQYTSGSWAPAETHPVAAPFHMGLSNDGSQVFIAEPDSVNNYSNPHSLLRVLDADTLTQVGDPYDYAGYFSANVYMGSRLAITNDGRIWLGPRGYATTPRQQVVFDPADETFGLFSLPGTLRYDNTSLETPRDGAKLFVAEIANTTFKSGVLNAATNEYTPLTYQSDLYKPSVSDDGSLVSLGGGFLYDNTLQLLATPYEVLRLAMPDWYIPIGVASPDGTRAYMMLYDSTDISGGNSTPFPQHSKPRIYVVDTTATPTPNTAAIKGYFEIDDYPVCRTQSGCDHQTRGAISPDGRTLFFAGDAQMIVVPIPPENTLQITVAPPSHMTLWTFDEAAHKASAH